jgi:hypothetical protein
VPAHKLARGLAHLGIGGQPFSVDGDA